MRIRHAFTGLIYETQEDGNVRVEDPKSGKVGVYTPMATYVSGDVLSVDHHLCGHVGGRTAAGGGFLVAPQPAAKEKEPA